MTGSDQHGEQHVCLSLFIAKRDFNMVAQRGSIQQQIYEEK